MKFFKKTLPLLLSIGFIFASSLIMASCQPQAKEISQSPQAVSNFTTRSGDRRITLSWTNPKAPSFSGLTLNYGTSSTELSNSETLSKTETSTTVTGLTNGTPYYFQITAFFGTDEDGNEITKSSSIISASPKDLKNLSSVDFAKELVIGWNLGNAFDASGCTDWAYQSASNGDLEYSWLPHKANSKTSQKLIKAVKAAGFNTIRIPISWHNYMSETDSNYTISSTYMNRVKEVVDWAMDEDMFVIINIHHDNLTVQSDNDPALKNGASDQIGSNPGFALTQDSEKKAKSKAYIEKVWEQISNTFKDYDYHLIFEVLNEPRCVETEIEWGISGNDAITYCNIITEYEQAALNKIRASGGNNTDRFVMVPGYAASPSFLDYYKMPTDTTTDKLLLSVHAYTPGDFALGGNTKTYSSSIESAIDNVFTALRKDYVNKGIGVVIGEASASDKENKTDREKWATYYFTKANAAEIPVVLWDNEVVVSELTGDGKTNYNNGENGENHGYFNRQTCTQYFPTIIKAMMDATAATVPPLDVVDCGLLDSPLDLSASDWSINTQISAGKFVNATNSTSIKLTFERATGYSDSNSTGRIKLLDQWGNTPVLNKELNNVSLPGTQTYTPNATEWEAIKTRGLIVYGYGPKITKIELVN